MLKIVFAGTPQFAAQHLQFLMAQQHAVVAVFTQPDRRAGRGNKTTASAVKVLANKLKIPVFQPASFKSTNAQEQLRQLNADILVVVAYGLILPRAVLDIPRLGCINVHASLLPRWRGAAPIQRAIEAGDTQTGVTIMQMDEGLDTGRILGAAECPIEATDSSADLLIKLCQVGGPALLHSLDLLERNSAQATAQDDSMSCYAGKIDKREALLDWTHSATTLERQVRAFNPAPVAYSTLMGERIKIWRARAIEDATVCLPGTIIDSQDGFLHVACGQGTLLIDEIQLAGKSRMAVSEVLHSRRQMFFSAKLLGS